MLRDQFELVPKSLIGGVAFLVLCIPFVYALIQLTGVEVKVDWWQLLSVSAAFVSAGYGARKGALDTFRLQKRDSAETARLLLRELIRSVNRRLSSWDEFEADLNNGDKTLNAHFKVYDWLFMEAVIHKIDLFQNEGNQQDIITLIGRMKDLEYAGCILLDAKNEQIAKWREGRLSVREAVRGEKEPFVFNTAWRTPMFSELGRFRHAKEAIRQCIGRLNGFAGFDDPSAVAETSPDQRHVAPLPF